MKTDDISPWIPASAYLFGFALILTAKIDLLTTVWPMRPTDMAWRYAFLGLSAGYLQTPTLGLGLIAGTAMWQKHVLPLRAVGVVCLLTALTLVGVMGIFALDVLAMRQLRPEEAQAGVLMGGMFQEVKYFVATFVFAFLGHGALKSATVMAKDLASRPRKPGIVAAASRPAADDREARTVQDAE